MRKGRAENDSFIAVLSRKIEGFMQLLDKIKTKIDQAQVVSFDIFDTLLLRPYVKPVDLFEHVGQFHNKRNFQQCRIQAEQTARQTHYNQVDITLDQIYAQMPQDLKFLKEEEIRLEKQVLTPNKSVYECFEYAKAQGKKIVVASDMYIPSSVLADILQAKGYVGYDKLYVSGEHQVAKFTGSMYERILNDFHVPPENILHIGDNKQSDYEQALAKGIVAVLLPKVFEQLCEVNSRVESFYKNHPNNLEVSILLGLNAILLSRGVHPADNYWRYFGALYGGPVCYAFMHFALARVREHHIDKLLFVARDGYVLEKVFNLIKDAPTETAYIYAPRILSLLGTLDYERRMNVDAYERKNLSKHLLATLEVLSPSLKEEISTLQDPEQMTHFIAEHKSLLQTNAKKILEKYAAYCNSFNLAGKRLAMVDTITTYFAAHNLLNKALEQSILGIYWVTNLFHYPDANKFYKFCSFSGPSINVGDWRIMEFIMTSPERPLQTLENGQPVYKEQIRPEEERRIQIFPDIEMGILEFVHLAKEVFAAHNITFSNATVTDWINDFCYIPTPYEKEKFSSLGFAVDCNHEDYLPFPAHWFAPAARTQKLHWYEYLFSVRKEGGRKIIRLCGIKIKCKRRK